MPYCPNGHGELEGRFCPHCGARLVESPPSAQGDSVRVRSDDLTQTQTVQVSPIFVMPSAAPTAQPPVVLCPKCGRRNQEQDAFDCRGPCDRKYLCLQHLDEQYDVCVDCAASMRMTEEKREVAEAASSLVVCPICGTRNQEHDVFDCLGPCGRRNLCLRHFDKEHNVCTKCAEAARREGKERQRGERARREVAELSTVAGNLNQEPGSDEERLQRTRAFLDELKALYGSTSNTLSSQAQGRISGGIRSAEILARKVEYDIRDFRQEQANMREELKRLNLNGLGHLANPDMVFAAGRQVTDDVKRLHQEIQKLARDLEDGVEKAYSN